MISVKRISVHKRRLDRGRNYYSYIQVLVTSAIFVKVFNITAWWAYALGAIVVFGSCYVFGYIDEKTHLLSNEQESYNEQNPLINKIDKNIELLKTRLL